MRVAYSRSVALSQTSDHHWFFVWVLVPRDTSKRCIARVEHFLIVLDRTGYVRRSRVQIVRMNTREDALTCTALGQ